MIQPPAGASFASAISSVGSSHRLSRFLDALQSGRPVTIVGIGSSVTNDFGGAIGIHQQGSVCSSGAAGKCRGGCVRTGWLLHLFSHINATWPHAGHRLINCGEAASPISFFASCSADRIDASADLVVVEPISTAAAPPLSEVKAEGSRRAFRAQMEGALRQVLLLPRAPAVVVVNVFNWCARDADGCRDRRTNASAWSYNALLPTYHASRDEDAREVAEYYGLPVVSTRRLLFHRVASNGTWARSAFLDFSGVHPTQESSLWLAGSLAHLLQIAPQLAPPADEQGGASGLPPPAWLGAEIEVGMLSRSPGAHASRMNLKSKGCCML